MEKKSVRTRSGGVLQVAADEANAGVPVFSLHGTPGSRLVFQPQHADARSKGIRLISYDRPGYGGSTPAPGRSVGDTAAEVASIADAMGIDRFGVWGFSGGGAPALACGALLPKRVVAVSVFAGVAPYPLPGGDWLAGTGSANVEDFQLMLSDRAAWERKTAEEREKALLWDREGLRAAYTSLCSEVDKAAMTDEVVDFFLSQSREGMREGYAGMRDDNLSCAAPWGFEAGSVRVPVQVWHGEEDRFVPFSHGQWLAAHVPGAEAHLLPGEGHVSTWVRYVPHAHSWLRSHFPSHLR